MLLVEDGMDTGGFHSKIELFFQLQLFSWGAMSGAWQGEDQPLTEEASGPAMHDCQIRTRAKNGSNG